MMTLSACIFLATVAAQGQRTAPPTDFDFWVGKWKLDGLSYPPGGGQPTPTHSTNHIEKILDDRVVHENFVGPDLKGQSWTVYTPGSKLWRQTWVDNQGGYIVLTGQRKGDTVTLVTIPNPARPNGSNRMIFTDIKADSFTWKWEGSTDGGKTWQPSWVINYKRA